MQGLCVAGAAWDSTAGQVVSHTTGAAAQAALPALSLKGCKMKDVLEAGACACCLPGGQECLWLPCHQRDVVSAGLTIA